jgi:hypothetical protein
LLDDHFVQPGPGYRPKLLNHSLTYSLVQHTGTSCGRDGHIAY